MSGLDAWLRARGPRHWREVRYPGCGVTWEASGHYEYGLWLSERDDDMLCDECGAEGEA